MFNAVTEKGGLRLNQGTQGSHRLVCIGNNAPSQILPLGIHHSGTSVLTNMTLELGAYGGDRADFLLVEKNPMKWWERRDVVKHEQRARGKRRRRPGHIARDAASRPGPNLPDG